MSGEGEHQAEMQMTDTSEGAPPSHEEENGAEVDHHTDDVDPLNDENGDDGEDGEIIEECDIEGQYDDYNSNTNEDANDEESPPDGQDSQQSSNTGCSQTSNGKEQYY